MSYEAILWDPGESLIKASSAAEALEQLLRCDIAVILADVCMPELDGFEVGHGMTEMLHHSLGPKVEVHTEFDVVLAPVQVDPNELERALLNLALNARDAAPSAQHRIDLIITARSERIEAGQFAGLERGDYIRIGLKGTGQGMDEETLRRATEPFFTTKERGRGAGLGLSVVHGFAAQSGGAMRISSRVGEGTLVELWIPAASGAIIDYPVSAAALTRAAISRSVRVLAVDDDPLVGESTAAMLEDLGHVAFRAESVTDALDIMRSECPSTSSSRIMPWRAGAAPSLSPRFARAGLMSQLP